MLAALELVRRNDRVLDLAGTTEPVAPWSLDAIHLATARRLGTDLAEIVSYDDRFASVTRAAGHKVAAPT